jgi:hypothetical protein
MWAIDEFKAWNTPEVRARIGKAYPLRRIGRPEDIAPAVVFLASDAAAFITGQTLRVSGGYTMMWAGAAFPGKAGEQVVLRVTEAAQPAPSANRTYSAISSSAGRGQGAGRPCRPPARAGGPR